jgi:hypothetical protein
LAVFPGLVYLLAMLVASVAPAVSLVIYGGMPVLYVLSITVLRSGRKRNQEYADFTEPALAGSVPRRVSRRPP